MQQSNQQPPQTQFKTVSNFTSLASFPVNFALYGQNRDEYILLFIREHKIVLFFSLLFSFLMFTLPFVLRVLLEIANRTFLSEMQINFNVFFESKYWFVFLIVWTMFSMRNFLNTFLHWFYNINILTTSRFVDIDLKGIFNVMVSETDLLTIEDIKDHQPGIIQSLFHMGDLEVLTASGGSKFNLKNVYHSHKVRDFINDVVIGERDKIRQKDNGTMNMFMAT